MTIGHIKQATGRGVAVIGCGYWGVNYLRVLRELAEVGTVFAYDPQLSRIKEVVEQFPHVVAAESFEEVLQSPDIDAAIIATPAALHFEVAAPLLDAGKHLLVEKPIAKDSHEVRLLIEKAESLGLTLMVGHTFLFNAGVRAVKQYIAEAAAGSLYYVYSRRTNLGPIRRDVNALWDLAPHDISIFSYLLQSEPAWVSAVGSRVLGNSRVDVGFVSIGYENGVVAHIHVSWADPFKVRELVVVGSERRIVFNDLSVSEPVRIYEQGVGPLPEDVPTYGEYPLPIREGDIISPRVEPSEPLKNQTMHFLEAVATGARPTSDGRAGLSVVEVMEAIDRSIELNGVPVSVGDGQLADAMSGADLSRPVAGQR